jgi:NADPH-dependent 7-cyano-7-deazaguanine reductase QueF-like protein
MRKSDIRICVSFVYGLFNDVSAAQGRGKIGLVHTKKEYKGVDLWRR